MHPISREIREDTLLLCKLLEDLGIPGIHEEYGIRGASKRARKAAQARWNRGNQAS
jgi:hypothetical protein